MLLQLLALGLLVQTEAKISKQNSYADADPYVVKGFKATYKQFPWHADLRIHHINKSTVCGGSLINENVVLTAAHCTDGAIHFEVNFGNIFTYTELFKTYAKRIVQHPNYVSGSLRYDIALIELWKSPPISENITMVALASKTIAWEIVPSLIGTVCGFRNSDNTKTPPSRILVWLKVCIISNKNCKKRYGSLVTNDMICADGMNLEQNICSGDSGGGLVVKLKGKYYLVGITAFGPKTCVGGPVAYTRVSSFVDWIFDTIASLPTYKTL